MKVLPGRKTVLTPLIESDIPYLVEVYKNQRNKKLREIVKIEDDISGQFREMIRLGTLKGWVALANWGKKAKKAGVVYFLDNGNGRAELSIAMDQEFLKGLEKRLRENERTHNGYTIAEEALFLATRYCFSDLKKDRVDTVQDNRTIQRLVRQVGFKKEASFVWLSMHREDFYHNVAK